jgi:hypothetical protein
VSKPVIFVVDDMINPVPAKLERDAEAARLANPGAEYSRCVMVLESRTAPRSAGRTSPLGLLRPDQHTALTCSGALSRTTQKAVRTGMQSRMSSADPAMAASPVDADAVLNNPTFAADAIALPCDVEVWTNLAQALVITEGYFQIGLSALACFRGKVKQKLP